MKMQSFHFTITVLFLFQDVMSHKVQRFDGWYNNLGYPHWGSAGEGLVHNVTTTYADFTYLPRTEGVPSARYVSSAIFRQNTSGESGNSQKNALFAFFGQLVTYEILDTDSKSCPVELMKIKVPQCDVEFDKECSGENVMPYERIQYDKDTGQSPNSPRRQVNLASSYIDASFVYGTSSVRASYLRALGTGKLASIDLWEKYPELNSVRLPFVTFPNWQYKLISPVTLWKFGDRHAHENPALLSLSVLFFRYHNYLAEQIRLEKREMTAVDIFYQARRWVTASLQNIIMYEWLPQLLNTTIPEYEGYKTNLEPGITAIFDAAAIRYIMTLIPMGIQQLESKCEQLENIRLCKSYFDSQTIVGNHEHGFENIMRGMLYQAAEKDDMHVVPDLLDKYFGPLHYSRQDFVAQTIMKGRDYGLPDYNSVRRQIGLNPKSSFEDINPNLAKENPQMVKNLRDLYGDLDKLDVFVGGMLETNNEAPGELFSTIIQSQFYNIRHGDWFWFENTESGIFTPEEIRQIKSITLIDVLKATKTLEVDELPKEGFKLEKVKECNPLYIKEDSLPSCPDHRGYDYFSGSEFSFIILWTCFGLIPFICILSACIAAKCRKWKHANEVRRMQTKTINNFNKKNNNAGQVSQHIAYEWMGEKEDERAVVVKVKPECEVEVTTSTGRRLRSVYLCNQETVDIMTASNKGRTCILIKVPKEYDLVLKFSTSTSRQSFEDDVIKVLECKQIQSKVVEARVKDILKDAFTQKKRNARLEKFFKSVFSEAFQMDIDPSLEEGHLEKQQTKEILEIELNKEEFAQALAVKPNSEFVENMFSMLDTDRNGYISFRDFLHMVVIFSKGSCQEKLQTMFGMFDIEGRGVLHKSDLIKMFSSLLDMANSSVSKAEVSGLVDSICQEHGLQDQTDFHFENFCQILSPQMDKLWNAGLDWKGRRKCYPTNEKKRGSENGRRRSSATVETLKRKNSQGSFSQNSDEDGSKTHTLEARRSSDFHTKFIAVRERYHPVKSKIKTVTHFVENNRQHIFYLILFFGITFVLFAERFYYYTVEREHSGLRMMMSYGISVTRGAAAAMSFTFSFLLLTMCRNLITWLRGTFLNMYIPFDSHVTFHKVVAWTALFFTCLHIFGYAFNFYHLATQPTSHLCVFDSIVLRAEYVPSIKFWFFGNMTGFTGVLLVIIICIIYIYATQTARSLIFNGFWLTHKLISVLYILTILHGASTIVQKPMFFLYFVGPAILFTIDKMISMSRKKTELDVIRAEKLPSDITFIEFKRPSTFDYQSGQWVRIACLSHGTNEYHPFTLTSAPHEDTLSLHIRALGPWTWNIRQTFDPENHRDGCYPPIYLDGPYGAGQQDWYQYEVSVLVGAGIGVTPYAAILKDFVHMAQIKSMYKMKCQKLYFIWVTGSQRHFEWFIDIMREVEEVDEKGLVSIDIFITQFFQNFDMRTAMLYICEEHFQKLSGGRSVFTGLKATTHFGRPQLPSMFNAVHRAHPMVKKVGVFSCGPPGITKSVEQGCITASNTTRALFEHHFENF